MSSKQAAGSAAFSLDGGLPPGAGRRILAAFASLATPLVALMVYLNPTGDPLPHLGLERSWPPIALVSAFGFLILWRTAVTRRRGEYFVLQALGVFFCVGVYLLGAQVHRDFLSVFFMHILSVFTLTLVNRELLATLVRGPEGARSIRSTARVVILIVFAWIVLMGYAIVTRSEPRYRESIVYNVFNATLGLALFMAGADFRFSGRRRIQVGPETVILDDIDISVILSAREREILGRWVGVGGRNLVCRDFNEGSACPGCGDDAKATGCPRYKKTQEAVKRLDKVLRALGFGWIEGPANRQAVLREGWRLRLAKDAVLEGPSNSNPA